MSNPLEALARRAQNDDFFLGAYLAAYARSERLDDAGLAEALGCPVATLIDLRLCRAPREVAPGFGEDVDRISSHFGLAPARLVRVVRRGRALLQANNTAARGLFMAARDGEAKDEEQP